MRLTVRYHHPEWLLHRRNGERVIFPMGPQRSFVLDPTHPEVLDFLERLYHRLTHEWGFTYHKLDFTRAIGEPDVLFYDRTKNRAEAYRAAFEAIAADRRCELPNVCGGSMARSSVGRCPAHRLRREERVARSRRAKKRMVWPLHHQAEHPPLLDEPVMG